MLSRILATIQNGGQVPAGALGHGDPDPTGERCDRCSAEALILLERDADTLAMCGHHYDMHWRSLLAGGWEVTRDTRSGLRPAVPVIPGNG